MEILALSDKSFRIKGKQTTLVINPMDKSAVFDAAVVFDIPQGVLKLKDETLTIDGPGEYEVGGLKITGLRLDEAIAYIFSVDDLRIILLDNRTLAKFHAKLPDVNLVVIMVVSDDDLSNATNVAGSAVLYYGEKAEEVVTKFIKEGVSRTNKYSVTKDKLPTEVQQILLV